MLPRVPNLRTPRVFGHAKSCETLHHDGAEVGILTSTRYPVQARFLAAKEAWSKRLISNQALALSYPAVGIDMDIASDW